MLKLWKFKFMLNLSMSSCNSFHFRASDLAVYGDKCLPSKKISVFDGLSFGKHFTSHMLPIEYCGMHNEWKKPKIIPFCNLSISPAAPCLNYAIECFDGMACIR